MSGAPERLAKVSIDLPGDSSVSVESFWALPLGDGLYELRNSPWLAYDLHFGDVVRAEPDDPGALPRIREVVRRSGHRTLRVIFHESVSQEEELNLLKSLHRWQGFHEHASGRYYAIDVGPEGDYGAVCDQLWQWEQEGKLEYETGTTREDEE
jgi:hypothetical protein